MKHLFAVVYIGIVSAVQTSNDKGFKTDAEIVQENFLNDELEKAFYDGLESKEKKKLASVEKNFFNDKFEIDVKLD